jgi:cellulose synthase/poly-beta-1,6-N-acetylglucosamine synthase-like glycosyltransferase
MKKQNPTFSVLIPAYKSAEIIGDTIESILGQTYKDLEFNRLQNRVTYRGLYHHVSKKRMKPPLRSLWQNHGAEITRLIPAWMVTPESVSATWDMQTRIDLVIFDEASQCFAEKGIQAAYRGN